MGYLKASSETFDVLVSGWLVISCFSKGYIVPFEKTHVISGFASLHGKQSKPSPSSHHRWRMFKDNITSFIRHDRQLYELEESVTNHFSSSLAPFSTCFPCFFSRFPAAPGYCRLLRVLCYCCTVPWDFDFYDSPNPSASYHTWIHSMAQVIGWIPGNTRYNPAHPRNIDSKFGNL